MTSIKTFFSNAWLFVYLFHWKSIKNPGYSNGTIISCTFSSVCCWLLFALYLSLRYLVKPVLTFICFYSGKIFHANMNCEIQIKWKSLLSIIKIYKLKNSTKGTLILVSCQQKRTATKNRILECQYSNLLKWTFSYFS